MSPRTFVSRGAALLALAAFGLAACESKTVVQPNTFPLQVVVSPSSLNFTAAGQKAQLSASVTGGETGQAAQGVNWSSGNTAVATVDASGNVTAVANGTTTIIATSKAVNTVSGAAAVTVTIAAPPPTQTIPPTITLAGLTNQNGVAIPASNVNGVVNIVMNIEPNNNKISKVQVKVNGAVACENTFTQASMPGEVVAQGADASTVVCTVNTAALNANGTPVYPNGTATITADLLGSNGASLASTSQTITLTNVSGLAVTIAGAKSATDPAGLLWQDSTVTVVVTPSIFTGSTQLQTITVSLPVVGGNAVQTKTVTNNGAVTFTFRADTAGQVGTAGVEDAALAATATAITTAGQNFQGGLGFTSGTIRYDNAAPTFPDQPDLATLAPQATPFMNAAAVLSLTKLNAVVADGGVDQVTVAFQVSPNTSTKTWVTDTSVAQIGEQAAAGVVLRIQACDKLGNCANSNSTAAFGVDLTPPPVNSVTADTLNPVGAAVTVNVGQDNLSGFDLVNGFVQVKIIKDSANASGTDITRCVNPATGALASISSSAPCNFTLVTSTAITIPAAAGSGYYTITVFAQDLAGNQTASTTKVSLVDVVAPTVSITSRGLVGNIPSVSASIKDNVDLGTYQPFANFSGAIGSTAVTQLPMAAATQVGAFGLPLTAVATPTATLPFGSVQAAAGSATVAQLASVGFNAFDVAGNAAGLVSQSLVTAGAGVNAADFNGTAVAASPGTICKSGVSSVACTTPSPAVTATSTSLTATVTFNAGTTTANPIVAVYFYAVNGASAVFLGSSSSAGFGVNTANQRVYTFTASGAASALPVTGANTVFAIGVDANGNGVFMGTAAVTTL